MRIYTRTGDDGTTGLYGGARVSKASERVDVYGTVDELNAALGWARAATARRRWIACSAARRRGASASARSSPSAPGKDPGIAHVADVDIDALRAGDRRARGGARAAQDLRAPRRRRGGRAARTSHARSAGAPSAPLVGLAAREPVDPLHVRWLNRLSDLLFVQARAANEPPACPTCPGIRPSDLGGHASGARGRIGTLRGRPAVLDFGDPDQESRALAEGAVLVPLLGRNVVRCHRHGSIRLPPTHVDAGRRRHHRRARRSRRVPKPHGRILGTMLVWNLPERCCCSTSTRGPRRTRCPRSSATSSPTT